MGTDRSGAVYYQIIPLYFTLSILLKYPVDEEAVSACTITILVSSFQVDSRVPKHFLHHCLFMNGTCFFPMLKTLQTSFPLSVSTLICNCACHLKARKTSIFTDKAKVSGN